MKVILSGYGKIGHMVERILQEKGHTCIASNDIRTLDTTLDPDTVCIDFSTPDAFRKNSPFLARHFKTVVVGTTGWNDLQADVEAIVQPPRIKIGAVLWPRLLRHERRVRQ